MRGQWRKTKTPKFIILMNVTKRKFANHNANMCTLLDSMSEPLSVPKVLWEDNGVRYMHTQGFEPFHAGPQPSGDGV